MSYGILLAMIPAALAALFLRGMWEEGQKKRKQQALFAEYCGRPPRKYEEAREAEKKTVAAEENRLTKRTGTETESKSQAGKAEQSSFVIDEITWKELDMDDVFCRLDYTLSQAGTEYLYTALHHPAENREEAEKWEKTADYFMTHKKERIHIQMLLAEIGKVKGMVCSDVLTAMGRMKRKKPVRDYLGILACFAAVFAALRLGGAGLVFLVGVMIVQILTYFRERAGILPYLRCIAWLLGMVRNLEKLCDELDADIRTELERNVGMDTELGSCIMRLRVLRRRSFWVMQCGAGSSSPLSLFGDYIRMLLHPDIIQFAALQNTIAALEKEIRYGYDCIGFLDAAVSIAMYRMSLPRYCIPVLYPAFRPDSEQGAYEAEGKENRGFYIAECVHPLLDAPVANSIRLSEGAGVLLTGSNASGKSTFLKTIAVNLLLAQTIHTALADRMTAPFCRIYTAMTDSGSKVGTGRSSYMAEILSLKRILDGGRKARLPVFCFVDEILRGTGTVERIAASAQILKSIRPPGMVCFAATHDRELTGLLEREYDNYYFTEEIRNGDMRFSYRLLRGRADQNNAIKLLEAVGYDREIVEHARACAAHFLKEGMWK